MKKRILSLFLTLCMILSLIPAAFAVPADAEGHWGEDHVKRWADHGIVDLNELFRPDDAMTRGEVARTLSLLLGLKESANISDYPDIDHTDPNFVYISQCVAAGILGGRPDGTMDPNAPVSRQELFTMLGRAIHLQPVATSTVVFLDGEEVADYAAGYVNALVNMGAIGGVSTTENVLAPEADINRASVMAVLDKAITNYVDTNGATVEAGEGITLINADRVTVTGNAATVIVAGNNNEVTLTGSAQTANVVGQKSELVVSGVAGTVAVGPMAEGSAVQITETAAVTTVKTEAADSKLTVSGTVANMEVAESAAKAEVEVTGNATVENLATKADSVTVSGDGNVTNAIISGNNTAINTPDTKLEVAEGTTGTTSNGQVVNPQPEQTTPTTPTTPTVTPDYYHYHTYAALETTSATCTTEGVMTYVCYCGTACTAAIAALGHDYEYIYCSEPDTAIFHMLVCKNEPTVEGNKEYHEFNTNVCTEEAVCEQCGYVKAAEEHNYAWSETKSATCTETGLATGVCACGDITERTISALGHTEESIPAVPPTCTATGLTEGKKCSVCNETLTAQETVPAAGHDHVYDHVLDPNTARHTVTCRVCHSQQEEDCVFGEGDKKDLCLRCNYSRILPTVVTAEELQELLNNFGAAGAGNNTLHIASDIVLAEGETWTPVTINGYNGAGVITINGGGHTISGLNAPLFAGGFAGASGVIINDLTIADSAIVSTNDVGSGAFVEKIDSMPTITLSNCHLVDSSVSGSRTGGLIGWNSGYNDVSDGPVQTHVTITDCSVTNCVITGNGTVGGIVGHAGANAWTWNTIENCKVMNCTLTSNDDSYRVGAIVGTANVGEVKITNCTSTNNDIKQNNNGSEIARPEGQSDLYGRFVPGGSGKLTIDNVAIQ